MKPRIVREGNDSGWLTSNKARGQPYLALPWPPECPWTPETVMAACERAGEVLAGVPECQAGFWKAPLGVMRFRYLTPEFVAEPKKCAHGFVRATTPSPAGCFVKCSECGTILSDRRKGERRGKDRRSGASRGGYQRMLCNIDHRSGTDRRSHV